MNSSLEIIAVIFIFWWSICVQLISSNEQIIINKHDFDYIFNPEYNICQTTGQPQSDSVFMLIYVHSSPDHFKKRLSLRETWSRRSMFKNVRIVFMLGESLEKNVQDRVKLEFNIYQDIVQENFIDSYRNLTYKGIMAMKWISEYCQNAEFILKVDDDIITNTFILLKHLNRLKMYKIEKKRTIMCLVWVHMRVMRDPKSKWYISKDDYKPDYFSKYCSGSAYILTNDLPKIMFNRSFYTKFFWVDDFYMTGLLANASNVTHEFFNSLYIISPSFVEQRFYGKKSDYTVFGHLIRSINKVYSIWDFILQKVLNNIMSNYDNFKYIENFSWSFDIWNSYLL